MDLIIKISADYENFDAQIINAYDLQFSEQLIGSDTAQFTLPITESQLSEIVEFKKVGIYYTDGMDDILAWSGFIEQIEYNTKQVIVSCRDEKGFLKNKIIYEQKDFTTTPTTISDLLDTLVSEANTRAGATELSYSTTLTDQINKKWEKGADYFSILNDVAELTGKEWIVRFNEIQFKDRLGIDRTSGADFLQLTSSYLNPVENNINFLVRRDGKEIATAVIGKGGNVYAENNSDPSGFGRIEKFQSFDDGDLTAIQNQTDEFLNERKFAQKSYEIQIVTDQIDFTDVDVGDTLKLKIEQNNIFLDIDESVRVLSKQVRFQKGVGLLDLKISDVSRKIYAPQNKIAEIFRDVKKLQLK